MIYYSKGMIVRRYNYLLVNPLKDNEIPPETFKRLTHSLLKCPTYKNIYDGAPDSITFFMELFNEALLHLTEL